MMFSQWIVAATLVTVMILDPEQVLGASVHNGRPDCGSGLRQFDPLVHKPLYTIGVHAPSGVEEAVREFNLTFEEYLTATAGKCTDFLTSTGTLCRFHWPLTILHFPKTPREAIPTAHRVQDGSNRVPPFGLGGSQGRNTGGFHLLG
jgi:hypothetical protein